MSTSTASLAQFGDFLKSRRARLRPEDLGLLAGRRRRTPGLRREEVAQLAGVSVDYYGRLEQGRDLRPSVSVLQSISRALRLAPDERDYLFTMARAGVPVRRSVAAERVRPSVLRTLGNVDRMPALVLGRRKDVLAWNPLAAALLVDFTEVPADQRNMTRLMFLHEPTRARYRDWPAAARQAVNCLRLMAGQYPDDPGFAPLLAELSAASPEFRTWWSRHDVRSRGAGFQALTHPVVGDLDLDYDSYSVETEPDQTLVVYSAEPDGPSAAALRRLAEVTEPGVVRTSTA